MLVGNIDTYEFGVLYDKQEFTSINFLENLNKQMNDMFEIKIYYSKRLGYNQELQHLASKARIKNNDRYTLIAFLYIGYLNTHICVIQHSSAKYLTFKFYGLFQEKKESIEKSIFTIDFMNKLFENGYIIRNVKMDIAFDFNLYFDETIHIFFPIFEERQREVYVFKEGETVYFNSPLVNNCLFQQKIDKQNYNCSQKNCYFNIVIYNKSLKNGLNGNITRLEFSFKNVFNTPKIKYINNHMEFLKIINKLKFKIETYLFKTFDIAIQKNEDKSYLSFGKGAVNNTNYLKELKVI